MSNFGNTTETLDAYMALTDEELLVLRYTGDRLIYGTLYTEPADLIHEALHRALDGRRNWPKHVQFGAFMLMTMRSIVSAERKHAKLKPRSLFSVEEISEYSIEDCLISPSPEETLMSLQMLEIATRTADAARLALEGDKEALNVLAGIVAGMSATEMRKEFQLDARAFDAARHRVMRRIVNKGDQGTLH